MVVKTYSPRRLEVPANNSNNRKKTLLAKKESSSFIKRDVIFLNTISINTVEHYLISISTFPLLNKPVYSY